MAAKQTMDPNLSSEKWLVGSGCPQHLQEHSDKQLAASDVFPATVPFPNLPSFSVLCGGTSYDAENTDALLRALTDELAVAVKGITAPNPSFCLYAKGFSLHRNVPRRIYTERNLSHHMELAYEKVVSFSPIEKKKKERKRCTTESWKWWSEVQNLILKQLKHLQSCQAEVQSTTQCEFTYVH